MSSRVLSPVRGIRDGSITAPGGPLSAFRHRDFRVLLLGTMALQIGSWVQTIGMGWLVLQDLGGNATSLGLVALLRGASLVVVSPLAGYLGARFERRLQLSIYQWANAGLAALLAVLITTGHIELWMVFASAIGAGVLEALSQPIRMLLVYDSVQGEDLTNAVALNSLGGNAMRVIGPAIGGTLIGLVGTQGTFQLQALCLVLAGVLTLKLSRSVPDGNGGVGVFRSIGDGLRYTVRDRRMLVIVFMGLVPGILVYPYVSFLPVFARDVLDSGSVGYGMLAAAVGLGSLAGGVFVAATSNRARMGPGMMWSCLLYCLSVGAFAMMGHLWMAVAALAVAGVFHSVYSALNSSLMQLKAEPAYRSQVMSLQTTTWGLTPFAGLLMGRMIDHWGAPPVVVAWMVIAAAITLVTLVLSKEMRRV